MSVIRSGQHPSLIMFTVYDICREQMLMTGMDNDVNQALVGLLDNNANTAQNWGDVSVRDKRQGQRILPYKRVFGCHLHLY